MVGRGVEEVEREVGGAVGRREGGREEREMVG